MSTGTGTLSRAQAAKLAKEIEANRPTPEWDTIPELKKWKETLEIKGEKKTFSFGELVIKYKQLGAEIEFREKIRVTLKEAIGAGLLVSGEDKVLAEGYNVQYIEKEGSKKIDAQMLLGAGVSADVIARCTVQGKSSSYVDIRKAKDQ